MSRTLPLLALVLLACPREKEPSPPPVSGPVEGHHDEGEHEALPKQLRVTPEVAEHAGLATAKAEHAWLTATVRLPGEVTSVPDRTARLSAVSAGRLERVSFNEGQVVKKGEVLALLRVPDLGRLRGSLAATVAKAKASRANAERLRALKAQGLGAEQAVVDAEAEAHAQESEARALGEQLGAIGADTEAGVGSLVPLRAPISGVVVSRDAVVGQPVTAEQVLATVVDLSEVWFLGRVFEKDLGRLRPGAKTEVRLNAFPDERFEGAVEYVGQQTDPVARTLTARVRLQNAEGHLRLGLFGTAQVEVGGAESGEARVVVPRDAVTEIGERKVVFVEAKDGDYVVHEVRLGDSALGRVQILSGLDEGEKVVVRGVFTLKSLLLKSTLEEDHH